MQIIDQYAYNNRLRSVDPAYKVGLAFSALFLCLLLNKPQVGLTVVAWMYLLVVPLAGIKSQVYARVILAEGAFLLLATLGVVVNFSIRDPRSISPWALQVGTLWISSSPTALHLAIQLVARALGAAAAMNFLTLTTPLVDLLELARRWRAPAILVDLTVIMYRFIFVLLDSLNTMVMAQDSRLGYATSYWRAMNNAGLLASRLFLEAFQRSRRLQIALESRGYEGGDLQVLSVDYGDDCRVFWLGWGIAASLVLVWTL